MPDLDTGSRTSPSRAADVTMRSNLETLFAEVNVLAIRLRQEGTLAHHRGNLLTGSRSILQVLEQHGPQTVPQIARIRSTSRQNIQTLVNRLKLEGCIQLAGNPAHKRSALVSITESGRVRLTTSMEHEVESMENLLSQVSQAEVSAATTLLRKLRQLLSHTGSAPEVMADEASERRAGATRRMPSHRKRSPQTAKPKPLPMPAAEPEAEQSELPVNLL